MSYIFKLLIVSVFFCNICRADDKIPDTPIPETETRSGLRLEFQGGQKEPQKAADKNIRIIYGRIIKHDAENMFISKGTLVLRKKGHKPQHTVLRWKLPQKVEPGNYDFYTLFTLGGVTTQTFTVKAGPDAEHLTKRAAFRQKNYKSWKMRWQKSSSSVFLAEQDRIIQLEISGSASLQKIIKAFFLNYKEKFELKKDEVSLIKSGKPEKWLVTLSGGMCGLSLWGIETERYLRPGIDDPSLVKSFDSIRPSKWRLVRRDDRNVYVIDPATTNYSWHRGTGLAHLYIYSDKPQSAIVHVAHTGFETAGYLNNRQLTFEYDRNPPQKFQIKNSDIGDVVSKNEQGTELKVRIVRSQKPVEAELKLQKGWNRLLLRLHMQHKKGDTFAFCTTFTDLKNKPLDNLKITVNDPEANNQLKIFARTFKHFVRTSDVNNILHPGDDVKINYDLTLPTSEDRYADIIPVSPFKGKLALKLFDYDGNIIATKTVGGAFPGSVAVDFGLKAQSGYYAVQATLYDLNGRMVYSYPSDGFCVVKGTAAQLKRKDKKKMAVTYYFLAGGRSSHKVAFPWMLKMGIYRAIGSSPGFPLSLAETAQKDNLVLTMDFWDIHNSYTQAKRNELVKKAAPFTRFYKSYNEIDIHEKVRMTAEKWTLRAKGEYEAIKKFGPPNSVYVSGSLVRPSADAWFTECLKCGLDQYVDAWDVHAYPKKPPVLEGTCSNSINETELGVLKCYKTLGKKNKHPFWLGETGARACHGRDSRRWQTEMVAKMTACICSRKDFHYIGFLWPWRCIPAVKPNDIPTSHNPADAALYVASALIDGFEYQKLNLGKNIQAAKFGPTIMLWSVRGKQLVQLSLDHKQKWVKVDVVGRITPLKINNKVYEIHIDKSPVYILTDKKYQELTAF